MGEGHIYAWAEARRRHGIPGGWGYKYLHELTPGGVGPGILRVALSESNLSSPQE